MKKDLDLITSHHNREQQHYYAASEIWSNEYKSTEEYLKFLDPHSEHHETILNPIFLFEIKEIHSLTLFKQVLIRDGLLSAFIFFYRNPLPPREMDTTLYLSENLYKIIPKVWLSHCEFYKTTSFKKLENYNEKEPIYIIFNENNDFTKLDHFKKMIKKTFDLFDKKDIFPQVKFIIVNKNYEISKEIAGASKNLFDATKELLAVYPDAETINWEEMIATKLTNSAFLILNTNEFHISDDYMQWLFLIKGAIPLETDFSSFHGNNVIPLSPFHGVKILEDLDLRKIEPIRNKVQDFIKNNSNSINNFEQSNYFPANKGDTFIAPVSFSNLIREINLIN